MGFWKGQPPFTLYLHVSQCKAIPAVKQTSTSKAYQLYWDLFSACSLPRQASWHAETYRYKKGGRKAKNFYRILPSYILKRIHASLNFVQQLHLSRSSTLSPAASLFHPAPIKMLGVYHPLNSHCFRQNLSWGCKINPTPEWYTAKLLHGSSLLSWLPMPCHCEKFLHFFCD